MNPAIGYVLIALAVVNLVGLLLLFRRFASPLHPANTATPAEQAREPAPPAPAAIDPETLSSMLRRLENRLGDIEDQVRRGPTVAAPSEAGGNSDRSLALAQRLARQGAPAQDIAETCGISLTEAELLQRLHAPR